MSLIVQSGIGDFVPDGGTDPRKAYAWFEKGSTGSGKQPIIDDLGMGKLYYFFKTERDADNFMREYMKQYGVTDLSRYERVEVEITDIVDGEEALGFTSGEDVEEETEEESDEQIDFSEF